MKWWWIIVIIGLLVADGVAAYWLWQSHRERVVDPHVYAAARRYKVQPALIKAVIWQESGYDPDARGTKGELGLMQIRQLAAQEWADAEHVEDFAFPNILDPGTNVMVGTWYLRKALERYTYTDNCVPYALAEYNAGRSRVLAWNDGSAQTNSLQFIQQIEFPSTKNYVQSIMRQYARYLPEHGVYPNRGKE